MGAKIIKKHIIVLLGLVSGLLNGLLGTGGGTLLVAISELCGVKPKIAHATALCVILPICVVSVIAYFSKGHMELLPAVCCGAGGALGGFVGARLLKITPDRWLKIIFGVVTIILGITMLLR